MNRSEFELTTSGPRSDILEQFWTFYLLETSVITRCERHTISTQNQGCPHHVSENCNQFDETLVRYPPQMVAQAGGLAFLSVILCSALMSSEHRDRILNSPAIPAKDWGMLHRFFWSHHIHLNFLALLKSTQQLLRLYSQAFVVHNTLFAVAFSHLLGFQNLFYGVSRPVFWMDIVKAQWLGLRRVDVGEDGPGSRPIFPPVLSPGS